MSFRSIGEIAAEIVEQVENKRQKGLVNNENCGIKKNGPKGAGNTASALTETLSQEDKRHGC